MSSKPVLIVGFLLLLSGAYGLDRVGFGLGPLGQPRFVLVYLTILLFALHRRALRRAQPSNESPRLSAPARAILAFFAYQVLSSSWSMAAGRTLLDRFTEIFIMAISVLVYDRLAQVDQITTVKFTFKLAYWCGFLYFVAAVLIPSGHEGVRWAAFGGGPNVFVRVMFLGIIASAYLAASSSKAYLWTIPAFAFGALMSGSRGGLLAGVVVVLAALLWQLRAHLLRALGYLLAGVGVIYFSWSALLPFVPQFVVDRFFVQTVQERYTSGRVPLFETAWQLFLSKPFFGAGLDGFIATVGSRFGEPYVHNIPLAVAADGGLVGLLFLSAILATAIGSVRGEAASTETLAAASGALLIFIAELFSGGYYDMRFCWVFILLAAGRSFGARRSELNVPE